MFYKTGIDITNDKQMFNFLKNHFEYYIMNSWNHAKSIANNVKIYNLDLSGDKWVAYDLLNSNGYEVVKQIIREWEFEHAPYRVYFNGRSDGYLVLYGEKANCGVLPDEIAECEDYEEYKRYCKEFYGSVKANRDDLVFYTKLVQDFDRLCDELRDYCDILSNSKFEIIEMDRTANKFNREYADDLELLDFDELLCDEIGRINIHEICCLQCMYEAFIRIASRPNSGYKLQRDGNFIYYEKV